MVLSPVLFQLFMIESQTELDTIENGLDSLQSGLQREKTLEEIFRVAHTLHGAAGAVGAEGMSALAHGVEDVLDLIRSQRLDLDDELADLLQSAVGVLRQMRESYRLGVDGASPRGRGVLERLQEIIATTGADTT